MQEFSKGDYVRVAKDLGQGMSHFKSDCEAIVMYSYADRYGGSDTSSYSIHIKGYGEVSWYKGEQLNLIESSRMDILAEWEADKKKEINTKSSLDWIFSNGKDVAMNPSDASISALAKCLGIVNLWGGGGEGVVYVQNAYSVLLLAAPYLATGDKDGWLSFCDKARN